MAHPLHPMSVHAPLTFVLFTPLCDAAALVLHEPLAWRVSVLFCAGALLTGLVAATLGASDFGRAHKASPRVIILHASLMMTTLALIGVSLIGRVADAQQLTPPLWAVFASAVALVTLIAGAFMGGELVYRYGVGVGERN